MSKVKKGNKSWQPASHTDVINKEPGWRYRWSRKDPDTLAKRQAEHWETVSGLTSDKAQAVESNRIDEGKKMTSIYEKSDLILQRLPEEWGEARDEYLNNENERRISGLTAHIKKDLAAEGASTHGKITVTSRRGTQDL